MTNMTLNEIIFFSFFSFLEPTMKSAIKYIDKLVSLRKLSFIVKSLSISDLEILRENITKYSRRISVVLK